MFKKLLIASTLILVSFSPLMADDAYEPNDTRTSAKAIADGHYNLVAENEDWYKLTLRSGSVSLSMSPHLTNITMILYYPDGAGGIAAADPKSGTATENIHFDVIIPGTYFLMIRPEQGADTYTLDITSQSDTVWETALNFGPIRRASVGLYDIDNDGKDEIFVGTSKTLDSSFNEVKPAGLICLEDDGSIKWTRSFPATSEVDVQTGLHYQTTSVTTAPFFSNIDDDPEMEIIIGVGAETYGELPGAIGQPGDKGGIYALENDGSIKWYHQTHDDIGSGGHPDGRPDGVYGSPIVYDIDNDGKPEVIYTAWDRRIHILNAANGQVKKEINLLDTIWSTPTIADINNDNIYEILVNADISQNASVGTAQTGGIFHVISPDGTQNMPGFNANIAKPAYTNLRGKFEPQVLWSSPVVADIDKDGFLEIAYGTGAYFADNRGDYIRVWNHDGTEKFKLPTIGKPLATPLMVDLNNDGNIEIIATTLDGYVHAWDHTGNPLFTTQVNALPIFSSPVAVDINNDGRLEIVYSAVYEIIILDASGNRINAPHSMQNYMYRGTPAIKDIDNDGTLDLISGGTNYAQTLQEQTQAIVYRWALPGSTTDARVGRYQLIGSTTEIRKFVSRFYKIVLGRDADTAGLNDWTDKLATGTYAGADIARGFIDSIEFDKESKDDLEYVTTLYKAFFNREPDTAGLDGWLSQLSQGVSREKVLDGFLYSVEFANLSKSFNIKPVKGLTATEGIEKFVQRFYQVILNRDADPTGLSTWKNDLTSGKSAGADIARGFIGSDEFKRTTRTHTEYVTILYKAFFNREPDAAGLTGWVNDLNHGASRDTILNGFLYSTEFANLSQSYGIIPVR